MGQSVATLAHLGNGMFPESPLGCCMLKPKGVDDEVHYLKASSHKVQLAASLLGGIPGLMAYHTSVVIDGEEFFFTPGGVQRSWGPDFESHRRMSANGAETITPLKGGGEKHSMTVVDLGNSVVTGDILLYELMPHFQAGSYDLLHKNCNTFSDVALFYLLGKRLDTKYNSIEKFGANNPQLLTQVTGGAYVPNPSSKNFDVENLVQTFAEAHRERGSVGPKGITTSTVVWVKRLKSEQAQALNGKAGVVQRFQASSKRFEVRIGSELKALRTENVEPMLLNQEHVLTGLQSETAKLLNGERCRVVGFVMQSDRLEVELIETGEKKAVKPENVVPTIPYDGD